MFGQGFNSGFLGGPNYIYKEDIFGDSSCIGLYTMDYDFSDSSGNDNDMEAFGSPNHGVSGGLNLGARFDGYNTSARAYPVSDLQGLTAVSISFWFKWEDAASVSSYEHMVNIGDAGNQNAGDYFGIAIGDDGSGYNKELYTYCPSPDSSLNTNQVVSENVWHHVLFTYSGTSIKVYYDGNTTPIQTRTVTSLSLPNSAVNRIAVGHYSYNGSHHFRGDLDHLRVFNREIQSSELATLYNEKVYSPKATTTNINYPVTNVAYYKLDNSAIDETGSYNGTESNIEYRFGRLAQAAVFNGSSSYIYASGPVQQPTTNFSVSVWSKWDSKPSSSVGLVGNFKTGVTPQVGFGMTKLQNENVFSFWADGTANSSAARALGTTNFVTGKWYHTVGTYDGSNVKIYVNGVLEGTVAYTATPGTTDQPLVIGRWYGNYSGYYHDGQIDQVRIFSSALDSTQVAKLYNEKPEIDTSNFKAVLYEGNNTDGHYISNIGYNLDVDNNGDGGLVWLKNRTTTNSHCLFDTIRGANFRLLSNSAGANTNVTTNLTSFDANGFFLGNAAGINANSNDYVAWVWKGAGDAVAGTGTGVTNVSISANTDAGFSIVKYTGGNSASDTVNHGLTDAEMIILKDLNDGTHNWRVWHKDLSANNWLYLNLTNAQASAAVDGGIRNVDSNSFGFINGTTQGVQAVNNSSNNYIAYVWKSISGYSKIGSYSGGSTNTIVTGFKPSWVMVKNATASGNWNILDSRRGGDSNNNVIFANDSAAESTHSDRVITFQNNGFSWNATTSGNVNSSGNTYIYMAFK